MYTSHYRSYRTYYHDTVHRLLTFECLPYSMQCMVNHVGKYAGLVRKGLHLIEHAGCTPSVRSQVITLKHDTHTAPCTAHTDRL